MNKVDCVILAAGNGRRVPSCEVRPLKLFVEIAGFPVVSHVIKACRGACSYDSNIIIVTQEKYRGREEFKLADRVVVQKEALGTADAVKAAIPFIESEFTIVVCGDLPLIQACDLQHVIEDKATDSSIIAMQLPNDTLDSQYGRIFIDENGKNRKVEIIEYCCLSDEQKKHNIVNSGVYKFKTQTLLENIEKIKINCDKNEYYLTDIFRFMDGRHVNVTIAKDYKSFLGVNTAIDIVRSENIMQERLRRELVNGGVIMPDPSSVYLSYDTIAEPSSTIEQNVVIKANVQIKAGAAIKPFSYLEDCRIERNAKIGPFAVVRGGSVIGEMAEIGNFVEVKRSTIGSSTKSKHLAYIGDTTVGEKSNIGAGTITCNYDGKNKHKTKIGSRTMVGANTALIAPIEVGDDATIAAGTVITKNVHSKTLAFGRVRQESLKKKS